MAVVRKELPICSWKNQAKITVNRSSPPVSNKIWAGLLGKILSLELAKNANKSNLNTEDTLAILLTFEHNKH